MELLKRFKKDKKFRFTVVAIVLIAIMMWANGGEEKKETTPQSQCDTHNIGNYLKPLNSEITGCESDGCVVQHNTNPNDWILGGEIEFIQWVLARIGLNADFASCKSIAATGKWVRTSSEDQAPTMCESGKATLVKNNWVGKDIYLCSFVPVDEQCNDNEKGIAKLLWPKIIDDCKTAYFVTLFGGGFAIVMLLLVAL